MFPGLHVQITEQKTGNNVSKFKNSNWITQSYYSCPKSRVDFNRYNFLTSVTIQNII